jgi:hypothetical protein
MRKVERSRREIRMPSEERSGLVRIEHGIIAFKKDGGMLWFPDGNRGDCKYQRFIKTPEVKELSRLYAFPQDILDCIKRGDELEEMKEWLDSTNPHVLDEYNELKEKAGDRGRTE